MLRRTTHLQGRPFREGIRENKALWYGLLGASAVAFSGATDFMPELNRWLQIVEMEDSVRELYVSLRHDNILTPWRRAQFKFKLTASMVVDFLGCWIIEVLCKLLFADLEPKAMVTKGRERREKRRLLEEAGKGALVEANGDMKVKVQ